MPRFPGWATVTSLMARMRSLYAGVFGRQDFESEMREEFQHHVEMRTEDLVREGIPRAEASRQARVAFGHMETHRETARYSRGLHLFDQLGASWIDVKLGLRMLVKQPLLSLAAGFALAVGIPVGLAPTHVAKAVEAPLPEDLEDRLRAIRHWDPTSSTVAPTDYREFEYWARELKSFSAMAAFRASSYNVASIDGAASQVAGAELSPATFEILRTPVQLGRRLRASDGEIGAPDVIVIGHSLWASRFGSDPNIVGQSIRVGGARHTIVGVMPAGFRFPANEQLWLPLRHASEARLGQPVRVQIFGRLADGISPEQAQAEVSTMGPPRIEALPAIQQRLRPEVVPFGLLYVGLPRGGLEAVPEFRFVQLLALFLLLVACGNVAMLVFARTATRFREMAIRTALGATRMRIVTQVFVETLVLAVLAAGVGVLAVDWTLRHVNLAAIANQSELPYWLSLTVTTEAIFQALLLAAVSATIAGVVPAILITGRAVHKNIGARSGVRFGGLTSALVIADIAIAVAAVGLALASADRVVNVKDADQLAGIPSAEYLAVQFRMPENGATLGSGAEERLLTERLAAAQRALVTELRREPGVSSVVVGSVLPGMEHRSRPIEVEGIDRAPDARQQWVRTAQVDLAFFAGLGQRVIEGRDFLRADVDGDHRVAIVNTAFVTRMLGGRDPIGSRLRLAAAAGAEAADWVEIVGVVEHLGVNMVNADRGEAAYFPAAAGQINPFQIGIHAGPSPGEFAGRVREIAAKIDPELLMGSAVVLSEVHQGDWYLTLAMTGGLLLMVGVLVVLAASGIYAMLSLSVSERTREIGIRAALGSSRPALVLTIVRRSLIQIGAGALIGLPVTALVVFQLSSNTATEQSPAISLLVAIAMAGSIVLVIGLCSCLVPARRVLAIEASEAMRAEG